MTVKNQETVSEQAFMSAVDELENLAKGIIQPGDGETQEDLLKSETSEDDLDTADNPDDDAPTPDNDEDLDKAVETETAVETGKTFAESAIGDSEDIQKAVEVSDFLAALVDKVGEAIDGMRQENDARFAAIEKSLAVVTDSTGQVGLALAKALRKSFAATMDFQNETSETLKKSLEDLSTELSTVPAAKPKSKTKILSKSFEGDDETKPPKSKDEILKSLTALVEANDPDVQAMDIIKFEGSGTLRPHLITKLGL